MAADKHVAFPCSNDLTCRSWRSCKKHAGQSDTTSSDVLLLTVDENAEVWDRRRTETDCQTAAAVRQLSAVELLTAAEPQKLRLVCVHLDPIAPHPRINSFNARDEILQSDWCRCCIQCEFSCLACRYFDDLLYNYTHSSDFCCFRCVITLSINSILHYYHHRSMHWVVHSVYDEYKKLHSLQSLVRTTRRTKTANITKDDVTSASHRQKVTVLQK